MEVMDEATQIQNRAHRDGGPHSSFHKGLTGGFKVVQGGRGVKGRGQIGREGGRREGKGGGLEEREPWRGVVRLSCADASVSV